jgi:hypothetical protein
MRTLWNAICFLAMVNLFALVLVVAWLWQSGRLTGDRARDIRAMLATTVGQAQDQAALLATEAEAQRLQQLQEQMQAHPPADSETQIRQIALVHQQREESRQRLDDERRLLAAQLSEATARMEADAAELRRQQEAGKGDGAAETQRKIDEQFLRAVRQLEQIPPKQAKKMLQTLVSEKNVDQAVAYLNAMNSRAAAKVLREFKVDADIPLATELLERLRTRGLASASLAPGADDSTGSRHSQAPDAASSPGQPDADLPAGAKPGRGTDAGSR